MEKTDIMEQDIIQLIKDMHEYEIRLLPANEVLEEKYELSDLFYKRMNRMIYSQDKLIKRRNFTRNVAAVIAVVLTLGATRHMDVVVEAAKNIVQWLDTVVQYTFSDGEDTTLKEYELEYIPEGFTIEDSFFNDEIKTGQIKLINDAEESIYVDYFTAGDWSGNNEYSGYQLVELEDGSKAHMLVSAEEGYDSNIVWQDDEGTAFAISGQLTEEELLKMANSLSPVD